MILNFINKGHNGDLHYSKGFMRDLYNVFKPDECFLFHECKPGAVKDLEFLDNNKLSHKYTDFNKYDIRSESGIIGKNIFVNTWVFDLFITDPACYAISGYSNHAGFRKMYKKLGVSDKFNEEIEHYLPTVNFDLVEKDNVNKFVSDNKSKKILICNGPVLNQQSISFDYNPVVEALAKKYKNMSFILTQDFGLRMDNVFYTSNIINIEGCDLNEISYLSEFCDVLVSRSSGPGCYVHTKRNYFNKDKVMIGFTALYLEAFWYLVDQNGCKQIWNNDYSFDSLKNTIEEAIHYR